MSTFEVIVLGSSGTFPTAENAATGFLLRSGGSDVWLDAGTGTFSNLQRHVDFFNIDAVVLSHFHLDHILDVYPFYYGLRYSSRTAGPMNLKVYAPQGARERLEPLASSGGAHHDGFEDFLQFEVVRAGDRVSIGSFSFEFYSTLHPIETMAMRIEAAGRQLAYTADTGSTPDLIKVARGADLLIAEASLQEPDEKMTEVHMTAEEAGRLAQEAGVQRLVLNHVVPGLDPATSVEQAKSQFDGEVIAAVQNMRLEV